MEIYDQMDLRSVLKDAIFVAYGFVMERCILLVKRQDIEMWDSLSGEENKIVCAKCKIFARNFPTDHFDAAPPVFLYLAAH